MGIHFWEIVPIIAVVLIFFGAKRIPELARSLGKASYEFKKAKEGLQKESSELMQAAEESAAEEDKTNKAEK
ncbi:MAG: twin-arginine translocase TatA/TatE family subunit [Lentisphaerae bacterium]|nr:twin-arginine translocase TatA/TatE family subunit [Lentisphaerota bacterium]